MWGPLLQHSVDRESPHPQMIPPYLPPDIGEVGKYSTKAKKISHKVRAIIIAGAIIIVSNLVGLFFQVVWISIIISILLIVGLAIRLRKYRMDPHKSLVLIGPTNDLGYVHIPCTIPKYGVVSYNSIPFSKKFLGIPLSTKDYMGASILEPQALFVKQVKLPQSILPCSMCPNEIRAEESKFYALFNRNSDDLELFLHKNCIGD